MDKEYYMNLSCDTTMPIPWNGINCNINTELFNPNSSTKSYVVDQCYAYLESTLSSITPSAAHAASSLLNGVYAVRELIGRPGGVCNNNSSYNAPPPLSSSLPPPILDHEGVFGNSLPNLHHSDPSLACDPGFAERAAAKFSYFGSRSFNSRTAPLAGLNNAELSNGSDHFMTPNAKLPRVSSSPALKQGGSSPLEIMNTSRLQMENRAGSSNYGIHMLNSEKKITNSNKESSVSELVPSVETGSKASNETNLRKRKAVSRVKSSKELSTKANEGEDDGGLKRSKPTTETGKAENKASNEAKSKSGLNNNDQSEKRKADDDQKPPEPPKDYIHVRARRGQATDSHSLAERVRREKISERMKLLQDLVPGCNKVTGKALMLDEIINYVQSLQRQVEFLSMKLASVNPGLDFNANNILSKDVFQENGTLQQQMYPIDTSFYQQQHVQHQPQLCNNNNNNNNNANVCSVDPMGNQFPSSVNGFISEFPANFGEDDLHSIVQMGFAQDFPVPDQTTDVKIEL